MPWPTTVQIESGCLTLFRDVEESGGLSVPWEIKGAGRVMSSTATLIERPTPYQFLLELARGKANQLRNQAAVWQEGGLLVPLPLAQDIRRTTGLFGQALTSAPSEESVRLAQESLVQAYHAGERLVQQYIDQMFQARHFRQPRLDTLLGCCLGPQVLSPDQAESLLQCSNSLGLSLTWKEVEPVQGEFHWEVFDSLLAWALDRGLAVTGGPLVDFSAELLPEWLWLWERDLTSLASFLCEYVSTVVRRYQGRIRSWKLTSGGNLSSVLSLSEEEILWLTVRMAEAARAVDPRLELIIGLVQPWGEYLSTEERNHSPLLFADTLVRSGLNLGGLDLELVLGVTPRGSYCRDLLETSRLLDLYSVLGVPLRVTLGYPAQENTDPLAPPKYRVEAGQWHQGFSPEIQAEWAMAFAALCLCKPTVRGVHWVQFSDASPHILPHCGLLDAGDQPRPALQRLRDLREFHLR